MQGGAKCRAGLRGGTRRRGTLHAKNKPWSLRHSHDTWSGKEGTTMETTAGAAAIAANQSVAASDSPAACHSVPVICVTSQRTVLMDAVGVQWQLVHDSVTCVHINRPQVDVRALVPMPVAHPDTCGHVHGQEYTSPPPKGQTPSSQICRRLYPRNSEKMLVSKAQTWNSLNSKAESLELRAKMLKFSAKPRDSKNKPGNSKLKPGISK